MNVEKIKNTLAKNNRVTFKLYSLEYEINIVDNYIQIFSPTYPKHVKKCNTLEELLNNFQVYNESLLEVQDRIIVYE